VEDAPAAAAADGEASARAPPAAAASLAKVRTPPDAPAVAAADGEASARAPPPLNSTPSLDASTDAGEAGAGAAAT
jgi:hypothetical protein